MPYTAMCCHQTTWHEGQAAFCRGDSFFIPLAHKGGTEYLTQSSLMNHRRTSPLHLALPWNLAVVLASNIFFLEETLTAISLGDRFFSLLSKL